MAGSKSSAGPDASMLRGRWWDRKKDYDGQVLDHRVLRDSVAAAVPAILKPVKLTE